MEIPTRAKVRVVVQIVLTAVLTPLSLVLLIGGFSTPTVQKLAAGWLGIVLGYWFK